MRRAMIAILVVMGRAYPAGANAATEGVLYSFTGDPDGSAPGSRLIFENGKLYSTTGGGGSYGYGTAFSFSPKTGAEKVIHAFGGDGDGNSPEASLLDVQGMLYGTTVWGGSSGCMPPGCGTVFSIDRKSLTEKVLYSFCAQQECTDGEEPEGNLVYLSGLLYSTTSFGGSVKCGSGCGTVFSVDPKTGAEKVVYSFCSVANCLDGWRTWAGLLNVSGTLYGTTANGGTYNDGVVFAVDPKTGTETVLHSFKNDGKDGSYPYGWLVRVRDKMYGTTLEGGASTNCYGGCGTVFAIDRETGVEKVVHSFDNLSEDSEPTTGMISTKGQLYGTTQGGTGAAYSLDPKTGTYKVLYTFCSSLQCTDGANPLGGLLDLNGTLYGTTARGGAGLTCEDGCGTVFAIQP